MTYDSTPLPPTKTYDCDDGADKERCIQNRVADEDHPAALFEAVGERVEECEQYPQEQHPWERKANPNEHVAVLQPGKGIAKFFGCLINERYI